MDYAGGCYCGKLRYAVTGIPQFEAQCHCRECQYISGGGPNYFMIFPAGAFTYTAGDARKFARSDLDNPVTREFCPDCGTHIVTRLASRPAIVLKVGTLDDPGLYGGPKMAIHTDDMQPFHVIADGLPCARRLP